MWTLIKWVLIAIPALIVLLFLHYTLPQHSTVRIVGTDVKRMDVGSGLFWAGQDTGTGNNQSRDVRFINTVRPNGKTIVFRNEDTQWGWPPYFKFDSADLSAKAAASVSTEAAPVWVSIRHYGWRSAWFSIFPNALSMRVVESPDTTIIPWFNIIFLSTLVIGLLTIYRLFVMWRRRRIDPVVVKVSDAVGDGLDAVADKAGDVGEAASGLGGRIGRWFGGKS